MPSRRKQGPRERAFRAKVWVEVRGRRAVDDEGANLLEQIAITGSLTEATQALQMSYRKAWGVLRVMNKCWPGPLVKTRSGGRFGGGMRLTKLGQHVLRTYRDLQAELEHLMDTAGKDAMAEMDRGGRHDRKR